MAWVDIDNPSITYVVFIGAQIPGTSYSGCVFDMKEYKWVSKVCLGINNRSFNFDPIYEACGRFREFVIPWALSTYQPGIKITTELPIITIQAFVPKSGEPNHGQ